MRKTSAAVLSLLFASAEAINVRKVEGYEAVDNEAEGVHVLDIGANTMSNSADKFESVMDFPGPFRSAFYAQTGEQIYDQKNGLWRQVSLAQDEPTAVKGPPEGQIGTEVYDQAMGASTGIPGDRSKSLGPSFMQKNKKVDPISPENYDPWVYNFSNENMPPYPQWQTMDDGPPAAMAQHKKHKNPQFIGDKEMDEEVHDFVSNHTTGLNEKKHHKKHHNKHHKKTAALSQHKHKHGAKAKDMADRGMDEEVWSFAHEEVSGINGQERASSPPEENGALGGWNYSQKKHHRKHHQNPKNKRPDVAERGMDEEVHGFVTDSLPPLNTSVRSTDAFVPNGSDSSAFEGTSFGTRKHHKKHHNKHHKRPDVAERGMDEEVHGFVTDSLPPLNTSVRSTAPFVPNGSDESAFEGTSFNQRRHHSHKRPDVAERGMDEEVHGFVVDSLPPLNTSVRSTAPFVPNGSDESAFEGTSFNQRRHHSHKRPDVAERGMDEEVHGFVVDSLPPLNTSVRSTAPFVPNGSDESAFEGTSFNQRRHHSKHHQRDIAERGMDEEVHGFVVDSLPPLNTRVRSTMPFVPNGSDPSSHDGVAFIAKRPDVAERGMDEEVHGFVVDSLPPLNTRVRSTLPFVPNGSDPSAHSPAGYSAAERKHHHKHHQRDIAERGMDEEVHGFCTDSLPPLNTRLRSKLPFLPNGSDASAHSPSGEPYSAAQSRHHSRHHKRPDINERGMDEEVHGFVTDSLPPLNGWERSAKPFVPNGSDPSAHDSNFMSRRHRDIAERGMDSDVWGFTSEAIPPMTTKERAKMPFIPNGSQNVWPQSYVQKPDIAERSMDETWVHPFTSGLDVVLPTANPWTRPYLPFNSNGGNNAYAQREPVAAPVAAQIASKDIANHEVRPDVYVTVHKLLNPVAMGRFREPRPSEAPTEQTWDDGPKPKEAPKPEFKFKAPKEVDEEAVMAKRLSDAAANVEKGKKAKNKADDASFKHDPEEKAKPVDGEEKKEKKEKEEEKEEKEEEAGEKKDTPKEKEAKALKESEKKKDKKEEEEAKEADANEKKEKKEESLQQVKKTLAQVKEDGDKKEEKKEPVAAPEKVHVLEPTVYQDKANTNTPNTRTTFYDKKKDDKKTKM